MLSTKLTLTTLLCSTTALASVPKIEVETLRRDVVIIGGGSSGTHAAVRLQDHNLSIALLERTPRLGGHVNTYRSRDSPRSLDYGVIVFDNTSYVRDYFNELGVPLASFETYPAHEQITLDFDSGEAAAGPSYSADEVTEALGRYSKLLDEHAYLNNGFNLPDPVPPELLLTFGDFVKQHDLQAMVPSVFEYNQGVGNLLKLPMLYLFKYLNPGEVKSLSTGFLTSEEHDNQALYDAALRRLGDSAFLSADVTDVTRDDEGVTVCFCTPDGRHMVHADKLVIAIPPTIFNLAFLDLDEEETQLFGAWNNPYYWDALLSGTSLPANTSFTNISPNNPQGLPNLPGIYGIGATGIDGLHTAYYSSPYYRSDDEVKAEICTAVRRIAARHGDGSSSDPVFEGFNAHNPFYLQFPTDLVKDGRYGRLEGLQGKRRTWWTGAAWQTEDSSWIWQYNEEVVVPAVLAGYGYRDKEVGT